MHQRLNHISSLVKEGHSLHEMLQDISKLIYLLK